jgi:peptidoglycan hydrolase-like protein with peptidoglycan-binding domain
MYALASANKQNTTSTGTRQNKHNTDSVTLQRKSNGRDAEALSQSISGSTPVNAFHFSSGTNLHSQSSHLSHLVQNSSIQAKLKIGKPNDKYEQEADRVAQQIMNNVEKKCPECKKKTMYNQDKLLKQNKVMQYLMNEKKDRMNYCRTAPSSSRSSYSFRGGGVACGINCPKPNTRPMIGRGSVGCPVPELQEKLNVWATKTAFTVPYIPLKVDGVFGSRTETVVKVFQKEHLPQVKYIDGIVGPLTWPEVDSEAPGNYGLPVGELTESHGWRTGRDATMHNWRHRLLPTSTNFFCGWVTESEISAKDECYESAKAHLFPYLHLTGGLWCIKANNWWGDDTHGLITLAVETYRKTATLPCTITHKQSMKMKQQNGDIKYTVHEMKYIIDKDSVTSKKDGEESTKKWP